MATLQTFATVWQARLEFARELLQTLTQDMASAAQNGRQEQKVLSLAHCARAVAAASGLISEPGELETLHCTISGIVWCCWVLDQLIVKTPCRIFGEVLWDPACSMPSELAAKARKKGACVD